MYFPFKSEDISKSPAAQLGGERSQHFEKAEKRTSVTHFKSSLSPPTTNPFRQIQTNLDTKYEEKKTGKRTSVTHFKSSLSPTTSPFRQIRTNLDTKYEFLNSQFPRYLKVEDLILIFFKHRNVILKVSRLTMSMYLEFPPALSAASIFEWDGLVHTVCNPEWIGMHCQCISASASRV